MCSADSLRLALAKEDIRAKDAAFFLTRFNRYPHLAQAPTSIKPQFVSGRHMSVRLRTGWRLWGFEQINVRDTFLTTHPQAKPFNV